MGVDYGDSVKFIEAANKVSVGGFTEVGDASNLLTQIMNIYGTKIKKQKILIFIKEHTRFWLEMKLYHI